MSSRLAIVLMAFSLLMVGCASNPGQLQNSPAMFGEGNFYNLEPGYVLTAEGAAESRILLGLQYNSDWGDQLFFVVRTNVANAIIPDQQGLVFVIDGERVNIDAPMSISSSAELAPKQASFSAEKSFSSNMTVLQRLLAAKSVTVEVDIGRGVVEGNLLINGDKTAIKGLREFAAMVAQ